MSTAVTSALTYVRLYESFEGVLAMRERPAIGADGRGLGAPGADGRGLGVDGRGLGAHGRRLSAPGRGLGAV